jgi:GDP-L-fucose synthase
MDLNSKIYIAGHSGLVGSAVWRALERKGYTNLIGRRSAELDLINQQAVNNFFEAEKPDYVVLVAAKVGGIHANDTYRAQFIYENLMIEANVIHAAYTSGVKKLLFLGSSCIYPKDAEQPMVEEALLTGPLEPTNEPYAIAKIAGIRLCDAYNRQYGTNFIAGMPTNMYGPGDNYHPENSHVLPALIRRFHEAKEAGLESITCWGSGKPFREFLYSDDLGDACVFLLENVNYQDLAFTDESGTVQSHINIGTR